jgi:anti-sigma factor RsiW
MSERGLEATLRRLLGPARPEHSCEECFQALDRYVDAEVAGADPDAAVPDMAAHLEGCPACAEDHASLRAAVEAAARGGAFR